MRATLLVTTVSLCLWYGILQGAIAVSNYVLPSFIPQAKHKVHDAVARARTLVFAQSFETVAK